LFVAGAYYFNFYGMLAAAVIVQFINLCYIRRDGGLRFAIQFDGPTFKRLLALGWPLAAEAFALSALRGADRLIIIGCLANGSEQLGWYKIAIMMGAWAFDQSNLVAGVLFPRLGETLGKTRDPRAVISLGMRAAELVAWGMIPCVAALLAVGIPAVRWLLPAYRPGLVASAGLVTAAALLGTSMPLRYALLTIGRARAVLVLTATSSLMALSAGFLLLYGSNDTTGGLLAGLSWTSAAAAAVLLVSTITLCAMAGRERIARASRLVAVITYMAAGAATLHVYRDQVMASLGIAAVWSTVPVVRLIKSYRASTRGDGPIGVE
jgi:hypothetical protein